MNEPVVWTIAGSDSSGGAGIQADLQTCQHLGTHGCSVVTAVTAQHAQDVSSIQYVHAESIAAQLAMLDHQLPAQAIKIGMLGSLAAIDVVSNFLNTFQGKVVLDPVLFSSSGKALFDGELKKYQQHLAALFPYVDLFTPNLPETEILLGKQIRSYQDRVQAGHALLSQGLKSVLIKGGHHQGEWSQDYWTNGTESFWLSSKRYEQKNYRGTGCVFSAAVAASLALKYELRDALVIAKMYVNQGMRLARSIDSRSAFLTHAGWPEDEMDLPAITSTPMNKFMQVFPDCGPNKLGLYPIVDSSEWLQQLLTLGVKTIQLRIKNKSKNEVEQEIKISVSIAEKYQARLFINDYWQLAMAHGAYGVHLGQDDLNGADMEAIRASDLRLGISTHCYYEVARTHSYQPSYIACGPIFHTTSKIMSFAPQGIEKLKHWQRMLCHYRLVAIGGIDAEKLPSIIATGVDGMAMISAITKAPNPMQQTRSLLHMIEDNNDSLIDIP